MGKQYSFRRLSSVVRSQSSAVSNETIWALKNVSFEACPELSRRVQRGEVVGIPSPAQDKHRAQRGRQDHARAWRRRNNRGLVVLC